MQNNSINQIGENNLSVYIAKDCYKSHLTGSTQIVYLISDDFIFKIKVFFGHKIDFIESIVIFDRHLTVFIASIESVSGKRLISIDKHLLKLLTEVYYSRQSLNNSKNAILEKNVQQAMDPVYLQNNVHVLKKYFD